MTSKISNSEHHTSANKDVTDSPNSEAHPDITTDEDSSGMGTRNFPFWPSPSLPAIGINTYNHAFLEKHLSTLLNKDNSKFNHQKTRSSS